MDLVTMSPPMPGFPATFEGVYCRLAPDAHVSVSDELSVMVYNRHATVVSLAEGFVDFEDDFGNHYSAHTAGLYLAAAEAQGIEVQTVPRHIDPLTGDFIYPV